MSDNSRETNLIELRKALKRCDLLIGEEIVEYLYQLYDPATGGFYYSISSRDMEGTTPFSEGTRFAIETLLRGGMTLPDWYKEKVSAWIKGHQDPTDGYFYEDLWGKITSGPRKDRDLTYSRSILEWCGTEPLYPVPQERLMKKDPTAEVPEYLKSRDAIIEYMDGMDWSTRSIWGTGQRLSSAVTLIQAAGLFDTVYDYIISKQNPETALWGEGLGWMNTNGAMKLSSFVNKNGHPYPNIEKMIESVLKIFAGDDPAEHATFIWNPFVAMGNALSSVDGETREKAINMLLEKGAEIVNFAVDSAMKLKRPDGGCSSSIKSAQAMQQGFAYGRGLTDESDMDGTVIAGHRLRASIHGVFGEKYTQDYYAHLNDEFWERCKNKPPIEKTYPCVIDLTQKVTSKTLFLTKKD